VSSEIWHFTPFGGKYLGVAKTRSHYLPIASLKLWRTLAAINITESMKNTQFQHLFENDLDL